MLKQNDDDGWEYSSLIHVICGAGLSQNRRFSNFREASKNGQKEGRRDVYRTLNEIILSDFENHFVASLEMHNL